jgi:hypothetical protein
MITYEALTIWLRKNEDTKGVIRSRKSKKGSNAMFKRNRGNKTNNDPPKTKDCAPQTPENRYIVCLVNSII